MNNYWDDPGYIKGLKECKNYIALAATIMKDTEAPDKFGEGTYLLMAEHSGMPVIARSASTREEIEEWCKINDIPLNTQNKIENEEDNK